jgi:hypothetical protein
LVSKVRVWRSGCSVPSGTRRTGREVRDILKAAANPPQIDVFPRSDGPGSSLDLPQFAAMGLRIWHGPSVLNDPRWTWSRGSLRTIGTCLDGEPIRFRAVPADSEHRAEYFARDFHDTPVATGEVVSGVPEHFVNNVLVQFGLIGVRIEAERMPTVYRGTGLGGSNLAHAAALIFASSLSGVDLSLSQIYAWGTALENNFGVTHLRTGAISYGVSMTGGQEMLAAFQGGVFDNVHLPFALGPHSVLSRELVAPSAYNDLENHLAIVNLGRRRQKGVKSSDVNSEWMSAWAVPQSAALHLAKAELAYRAAEALRIGDFDTYSQVTKKYREIRTQLCARYIAGQSELAHLCEKHQAEYFPVGAGGGTCLVCSHDPGAIREIRHHMTQTADESIGRTFIPYRVRTEGILLNGFTELGFGVPSLGVIEPTV